MGMEYVTGTCAHVFGEHVVVMLASVLTEVHPVLSMKDALYLDFNQFVVTRV